MASSTSLDKAVWQTADTYLRVVADAQAHHLLRIHVGCDHPVQPQPVFLQHLRAVPGHHRRQRWPREKGMLT